MRIASTTCSGKPPVAACSRCGRRPGAARRGSTRPEGGVGGLQRRQGTSVSLPVARIRTSHSAPWARPPVVDAQRRGQQDRGARAKPEEEGEERQGLLVAPLQVLQDQQRRPADAEEGPRQPLEEAVSLPGVDHGPCPGRRARRSRCPAGTSRSTSRRHTGSSDAVADWTAGLRSQSATGESASRPPCRSTGSRRPGRRTVVPAGELGHETALPHACTPADDGRPGRPPRRSATPRQSAPLGAAPHQADRGRGPGRPGRAGSTGPRRVVLVPRP